MLNKLFCGIDIGLKYFQFHAMDQDGNAIGKSKRYPNNIPGMNQMIDYLEEILEKQDYEQSSIGMEATGLYWFPLHYELQSNERIKKWNTRLIVMNPKLVESFRGAYADVDKTDAVDAAIIADRVRFGRGIAPHYIHDDAYLTLQRLTRFYLHLTQQQTNLKNYAGSYLYLTFSEWIRLKPFSDRFSVTATKLMKKFKSADDMANMPTDELRELLVDFSRNHFRNPEAKAEELTTLAEDSFRVPQGVIDSVHFLVKQTLQQLELLDKQLTRLKKRMEKIMKGINHPLLSIPGISHVTAALLIAEIGDVFRFPKEAKLAKYAGLTWRKNESGNFRAEETFMTKSGNVYLRQAFLTAAQSLINHNDEYKAYYQRKFSEAPRHAHKRAVSLTARKFVRLVYAMLTNNQLYMTPEQRSNQNKEVNQEQELIRSVEDTVADKVEAKPTPSNKKRKSTVAATSSSRHSELNGLEDPPEQYAVNT